MDGLAMMGFVRMFGLGAVLSALPVFVFLSVLSLGTMVYLEPLLRAHGLTMKESPVNVTPWSQIYVTDPDGNVIELNVERAGRRNP